MKALLFLIYIFFASVTVGGMEVLGRDYDKVKVAQLVCPLKEKGKGLIDDEKSLNRLAVNLVDVDKSLFPRISKLFSDESNFDNGLADSVFQSYALVFYHEGKIVMTIVPNLLGGDIYASDIDEKYDPRSFSEEQRAEFLRICFESLARQTKSQK